MKDIPFDYSSTKEIRRTKFKYKIGFIIPIFILLLASIYIIIAPFVDIPIQEKARGLEIIVFFGGIYFIFLSIWGFLKIYGLEDVRVYPTGISPPWKPIKNILKGQKYVIPFSKIRAIYPNLHWDIDYITLEFEEGYDTEILKIKKKWIYDLDEFLEVCKKKVKIKEDSLHTNDMMEYYTSRKGKKELEEMK